MSTEAPLARSFADAVTTKDHVGLRGLLHPDIDFRAMTPEHVWFPPGREGVIESVAEWFGDRDEIVSVEHLEIGAFADCESACYRLLVRNDEGNHLVEQQAYLQERESRIGWLRVLCSGYRRVDD